MTQLSAITAQGSNVTLPADARGRLLLIAEIALRSHQRRWQYALDAKVAKLAAISGGKAEAWWRAGDGHGSSF